MPRARRILAACFGIGLMLAGCTDPASISNEIQALNDVANTNMPAVQARGARSVGTIVMVAVTPPSPSPAPQPAPTVHPTAAPTPVPSPSGPLAIP